MSNADIFGGSFIWPEWNDADINKENWSSGPNTKSRKRPKAVNIQAKVFTVGHNFVPAIFFILSGQEDNVTVNMESVNNNIWKLLLFVCVCVQDFYEDPEEKTFLPPSLKAHSWKRPADFLTEQVTFKREQDICGSAPVSCSSRIKTFKKPRGLHGMWLFF